MIVNSVWARGEVSTPRPQSIPVEADRGRRVTAPWVAPWAAPGLVAAALGFSASSLILICAGSALLGALVWTAWRNHPHDAAEIGRVCRSYGVTPLCQTRDWTPTNRYWRNPRQYEVRVREADGQVSWLRIAMPLLGGPAVWVVLQADLWAGE